MSDHSIRAMRIPEKGEIEMIQLPMGETSHAEALAEAVGGYFERVNLKDSADMWINEDPRGSNAAFNMVASVLASTVCGWDIMIVGNAVVTGPPDAEGDCTPFTPEREQQVRAMFRRSKGGPWWPDGTGRLRREVSTPPCPCECNRGEFCGGCGHAGCGGRR